MQRRRTHEGKEVGGFKGMNIDNFSVTPAYTGVW